MMNRVGQQFGDYRLTRFLGSGGFAGVYLGEHIHFGTQVAIKVFPVETAGEVAEQFLAQARTLIGLEHPHIVRVLDVGIQEKTPFVVMDYVLHETLRQLHPRDAPVPLDRIAAYTWQIASALQYAHDAGAAHARIKPENMFLGEDEHVRISDFAIDILTQFAPPDDVTYTAPDDVGPASDQYSLATVVYEWLCGTPPFTGTPDEVIAQRRTISPPPLRKRMPKLSPGVEMVVFKALDREPSRRYGSVREFAEAFVRACAVGPEATELRKQALQPGRSVTMGYTSVVSVSTWSTGARGATFGRRNPFEAGFGYQTHSASAVALSPNGKHLAFGGWDETVQVYEIADGGRTLTYRGHTDRVVAIAWSPDGEYIASACSGETGYDMQVWHATTGETITTYRGHEKGVHALAWSADGKRIASGGYDNTVQVWDPFTGATLYTYRKHAMNIQAIAWSPDGKHVASSSLSGAVHVWEVATGKRICTYRGHYGGVNAVAWSPDGTLIASGGDDKTVQVWHAATREHVFAYRHHGQRVMTVGWSPDGKRVRSGSWDKSVNEWDATTGDNLFSFRVPLLEEHGMHPLAWTTDISHIACGSQDRKAIVADMVEGKLYVCHGPIPPIEIVGKANETQSETVPHQQPVRHRTSSMRGWGGKEGEAVLYFGHSNAVKTIAWSPDSSRIASGSHDTTVQIWDAVTRTTIFTYRGHLDPVVTVAWSPDGKRIASGSLDGSVKVWNVVTGREILTYSGHIDSVWSIAWSPDGTRIASGSEDKTVQVWSATSGDLLLTYHGHSSSVETLEWSPDAHAIASGGGDKTVQVWNAATGEQIITYRGHSGMVLTVAWSPDGKRIASGADWGMIMGDDGQYTKDETPAVHIWDALTGAHIVHCDNDMHIHRIHAVAWSPDGRYVAVGSMFHQVQVYDANTGEQFAAVQDHFRGSHAQAGEILTVAWSPHGTCIAAGFSGGEVHVWPAS